MKAEKSNRLSFYESGYIDAEEFTRKQELEKQLEDIRKFRESIEEDANNVNESPIQDIRLPS